MENIENMKKNNLGAGIIIFCILGIISGVVTLFTFGKLSPSFAAVGIFVPPIAAHLESTLNILSAVGAVLILFKKPIGVYLCFSSLILITICRFIFFGFNIYIVFGNVIGILFDLLFAYFVYKKRDLFWN